MVCTKLTSMYDKLEKSNVIVKYVPFLEEQQAISFESPSKHFWIGLNPNLKSSERLELCVLMEETAHYEVGIFPSDITSNSYADVLTREKNELRAKKFAVKKLVPREDLINYIKNSSYIDAEELADYFEVTPEFIKEALMIYGLN